MQESNGTTDLHQQPPPSASSTPAVEQDSAADVTECAPNELQASLQHQDQDAAIPTTPTTTVTENEQGKKLNRKSVTFTGVTETSDMMTPATPSSAPSTPLPGKQHNPFDDSTMKLQRTSSKAENSLSVNLPKKSLTKRLTKDGTVTRPLTAAQTATVKSLVWAPAAISIVGSTIIIFSYFYFKSMRNFSLRMVMYLSLTDWLLAVTNLIIPFWPGFCTVQAGLEQFCVLATILWTFWIAFVLLENLVKMKAMSDIQKYEPFICVFVWGNSLIFAILLPAANWHDKVLTWCWVGNKARQWRMLLLYIPLTMVFIYNTLAYISIFVYIIKRFYGRSNHQQSEQKKKLQRKTLKIALRFAAFLAAFFLVWIWGLVHRIINLFDPNPVYFLSCMQTFFIPAHGMMNFLAYGVAYITKAIKWVKSEKKSYKTKGGKDYAKAWLWCCCKNTKERVDELKEIIMDLKNNATNCVANPKGAIPKLPI